MAINPNDIARLTVLISPERLGKLTQLTGSAEAAIKLHQETLKLGAAMMHIIATVEIGLRNAICENLSHHFTVSNWLFQPPVPFQWKTSEQGNITKALDSARRAEYAKLSLAQKAVLDSLAYPNGKPLGISHLKRSKDRRRHIVVSDGKVIAELTFYFWKRLYGPDYEQSLWRTTLKRTFPDKSLSRATVADNLEHIYQSRNRLAHHEPVLHKRFMDTMLAIEFVIQHLGQKSRDLNTPLANLLRADIADVQSKSVALHDELAAYRNG